jgi:hypothetical protein
MMAHDDQDAVTTVPPPPGEDDPYCAATKVGALANEVLREKLISMRREMLEKGSDPKVSVPPVRADTVYDEVNDDLMREHGALITPPKAEGFMLAPPKPPSRAGWVMFFVAVVGIGAILLDALLWFAAT